MTLSTTVGFAAITDVSYRVLRQRRRERRLLSLGDMGNEGATRGGTDTCRESPRKESTPTSSDASVEAKTAAWEARVLQKRARDFRERYPEGSFEDWLQEHDSSSGSGSGSGDVDPRSADPSGAVSWPMVWFEAWAEVDRRMLVRASRQAAGVNNDLDDDSTVGSGGRQSLGSNRMKNDRSGNDDDDYDNEYFDDGASAASIAARAAAAFRSNAQNEAGDPCVPLVAFSRRGGLGSGGLRAPNPRELAAAVAAAGVRIGARVGVRNGPEEAWTAGTVVELAVESGWPLVRPDGETEALEFDDWGPLAASRSRSPEDATDGHVGEGEANEGVDGHGVAAHPWNDDVSVRVGDRVLVSDGGRGEGHNGEGNDVVDDGWGGGTVVELSASGWPVVLRDGWDEAFEWHMYRKVKVPPPETPEAARERRRLRRIAKKQARRADAEAAAAEAAATAAETAAEAAEAAHQQRRLDRAAAAEAKLAAASERRRQRAEGQRGIYAPLSPKPLPGKFAPSRNANKPFSLGPGLTGYAAPPADDVLQNNCGDGGDALGVDGNPEAGSLLPPMRHNDDNNADRNDDNNDDVSGQEPLGPVQTRSSHERAKEGAVSSHANDHSSHGHGPQRHWPRKPRVALAGPQAYPWHGAQSPLQERRDALRKLRPPRPIDKDAEEASILTHNFGVVGALWGLSFVIGPLTAGFLISELGDAKFALVLVAVAELSAFLVLLTMEETIQKKKDSLRCAQINPFAPLAILAQSGPELVALLAPFLMANAASGVHSILFLYLAVKFGWDALAVGLFFSAVGVVTAVTQGMLLPALVPDPLSPRFAVVLGLFLHGLQYMLFALCNHGWMLLIVMVLCCLGGLERPTMHALITAQVPGSKQGGLHGALAALRTLVAVVSVPSFSLIFAWSIGDKSTSARTASKAAAQGAIEGVSGETTQLGGGKISQHRAPTLSPTFTNFTSSPTYRPSPFPSASPSQLPSQTPTQLPTESPVVASTLTPTSSPMKPPSISSVLLIPNVTGSTQDDHGCLLSAGYSWCESLSKCARVWETNCHNVSSIEPAHDLNKSSALPQAFAAPKLSTQPTLVPSSLPSLLPSAAPTQLPSEAVIHCNDDILSFYNSCFDDCAWGPGTDPCSVSNSTACFKNCDEESIFAAVDYFSCYCEKSKYSDESTGNWIKSPIAARLDRDLSNELTSTTTSEIVDVGLSESHLEVPFLVASGLLYVAGLLALVVMRKFPKLGKSQLHH